MAKKKQQEVVEEPQIQKETVEQPIVRERINERLKQMKKPKNE